MSSSSDDLDGMDSLLFGEERVNLGGPKSAPVVWTNGRARLEVNVSSSSPSTSLMAHHVWQSSMTLGTLLAGNELFGILPGQTVVELGAGAGVPGLVCDVCLKAVVAITDYPDEGVIAAMGDNARKNGAGRTKVLGYAWGEGVEEVLVALGTSRVDWVLAADTLWIKQNHEIFLESCLKLMDEQTKLIIAFMHHDSDGSVAEFFFALAEPHLKVESTTTHNWRKDGAQKSSSVEYGDVIIKILTKRAKV